MTSFILLFISLSTGQPLTGANATLVLRTQQACTDTGQYLLGHLPEVRRTFTYECIPAVESPK